MVDSDMGRCHHLVAGYDRWYMMVDRDVGWIHNLMLLYMVYEWHHLMVLFLVD